VWFWFFIFLSAVSHEFPLVSHSRGRLGFPLVSHSRGRLGDQGGKVVSVCEAFEDIEGAVLG